jgi:hypothetical protein
MDTTGFVQYLQQRKDNEGLDFEWVNDEDSSMDRCLFIFKDAVKCLSDGSRPVLFDTKHGSNRYGLRLGILSTVGRNGSTVLLAAALLSKEDESSFAWVFTHFERIFGLQPHCIFTDGDFAMASALKSCWKHCQHFLCTWHLSQTIIKNTKGKVGHGCTTLKKWFFQFLTWLYNHETFYFSNA